MKIFNVAFTQHIHSENITHNSVNAMKHFHALHPFLDVINNVAVLLVEIKKTKIYSEQDIIIPFILFLKI